MIQTTHPLQRKDLVDQITPIERLLIEFEMNYADSIFKVLEYLAIHGKKRNMDIMAGTGLNKQMVRYARIRLIDCGLIEDDYCLEDMRGLYYRLTDVARQILGIDDNV